MRPVDYIVIAIIVLIILASVWFVAKQKKKGLACVGCPDSTSCSGKCSGCSGSCSDCSGTRH